MIVYALPVVTPIKIPFAYGGRIFRRGLTVTGDPTLNSPLRAVQGRGP